MLYFTLDLCGISVKIPKMEICGEKKKIGPRGILEDTRWSIIQRKLLDLVSVY